MAVSITYDDVVNGYETTVVQDEIDMYIDIINLSDACLDAALIPDQKQRAMKILAVRHILQMQANGGLGVLTGRRAPSGASQSFAAWRGVGISSSTYGNLLKQLDSSGCIVNILENDVDGNLGAWSVGGSCYEQCR